jgi:hypothetical protein
LSEGAEAGELRQAVLAANPDLSRYNPLPRILSYDDFSKGANGWCELIGNHDGFGNLDTVDRHMSDFRPPQLSNCTFFDIGTHGPMTGQYALKLATRPVVGHTSVAIKRLTMVRRGRVQLETYFTYKAEAAAGDSHGANQFGEAAWDANVHPSEAQFGAFTLGSDLCDGEGVRYHCVARYENTDLDNKFTRQWKYPTIPEPTPRMQYLDPEDLPDTADFTAPNPDDWTTFDEAPQSFCYNEVPTKVNWHYLRWQFDTDARRNVELQVNDRVMDMRDIPVPAYPDRYDALENLLNFYISVRTHAPVRNFVFLDSALISVDW